MNTEIALPSHGLASGAFAHAPFPSDEPGIRRAAAIAAAFIRRQTFRVEPPRVVVVHSLADAGPFDLFSNAELERYPFGYLARDPARTCAFGTANGATMARFYRAAFGEQYAARLERDLAFDDGGTICILIDRKEFFFFTRHHSSPVASSVLAPGGEA
jgi:hypothetical protein